MPVRIVSDGVVTRTVRDTAAFYREAEKVFRNLELAPIGDITRPGRRRLTVAVVTGALGLEATPEVRELTLKTAALVEGLGHRVEEVPAPVPDSFRDDFLLYWSMLATAIVRSGRLGFGRTWDPDRLDDLTRGLDRHCRRNLHRLPFAIRRLARSHRWSAEFHRTYDVVLSPTRRRAHPAGRAPRPERRLRADHRAAGGVGGVHADGRTRPATRRSRCRWPPPTPGCLRG